MHVLVNVPPVLKKDDSKAKTRVYVTYINAEKDQTNSYMPNFT